MKYFFVQERHIPKLPNLDYQIHIYQRSRLEYFRGWYKHYLFHWHGRRSKFYIPNNEYEILMIKVKDIVENPHHHRRFIKFFYKYINYEPVKIFQRANELLNTDPKSIPDKILANIIIKESINFFVKKWYWLHLPPFFYGFELYLKDKMQQHRIPAAMIGQWIAVLSVPSKLSANSQQEIAFLKLVLQKNKKNFGVKLRNHYEQYRYSVSAFGNEPFTSETLRHQVQEWKNKTTSIIHQRIKKIESVPKQAREKKQKIFLALDNAEGVKIASDLLGGMAYIRERNKEALGKVLYVYGQFYKEVARRTKILLSHTDYYLLEELRGALLEGKKVTLKEIKNRQRCVVILSEHNKYKKMLSGKPAHVYAMRELKEKISLIQKELYGTCGNGGHAKGYVKLIRTTKDIPKMKKGNILLAPSTDHELVPAMKKASAIVTDEGGILAHAAVISREFNIPCIIGTKIATKVFRDGDLVEVDANKGIVRKIKSR